MLWEVGRLTWEDLGKMSQPIVNGPMYLPHLYDAFKGYVWQIRRCHSGADLDVCLDAAEWRITDDGLKWNLRDLQTNRFEWWAPGKAVEIREQLAVSCFVVWCGVDREHPVNVSAFRKARVATC